MPGKASILDLMPQYRTLLVYAMEIKETGAFLTVVHPCKLQSLSVILRIFLQRNPWNFFPQTTPE